MLKTILNLFLICLLTKCIRIESADSYVYLSDKSIKEEMPIGSFVADLSHEFEQTRRKQQQQQQQTDNPLKQQVNQQFTLLEDSKSFFHLNSSSGVLITRRPIDRESMCLNRQCVDSCRGGSCKLNLKILTMPNYNILTMNVYVEDINDNKPQFSVNSFLHEISENVPVGYKIPIDVAFDADAAPNSIQHYEITGSNSAEIKRTFKLFQNPDDSQLHLVNIAKLDRENISEYKFAITAFDGGHPQLTATLNITLRILDANDNNPTFPHDHYKFSVLENTPIDSIIGEIKAVDADSDLNGLVKYSFIDNSLLTNSRFVIQKGLVHTKQQNSAKYFELNELTGLLSLKLPLDFEDEKHFSLTVEAKDCGVGSLPTYATVDINVLDVNDNPPDISISFLNSIFKNASSIKGFKFDAFLTENSKSNKFLAHVSVSDRDSAENGRVDWEVLVDGAKLNHNSPIKLVKLKNNSFTLNIAWLDREVSDRHNVSILAWDYGEPKLEPTVYNFSLVVLDQNDQAPKFEREIYQVSTLENEDFSLKVKAVDLDAFENAEISYSIKEESMRSFFQIDENSGVLSSKVNLDRETNEKFVLHVIATDHGQPPLSAAAKIIITLVDANDNPPQISFNTSLSHEIDHSKHGLNLKLGLDFTITNFIEFQCVDKDLNENSKFELVLSDSTSTFSLSSDFKLNVKSQLKQTSYDLLLTCSDFGQFRLNSTLPIKIDILQKSEFCMRVKEADNAKVKFINRDEMSKEDGHFFRVDVISDRANCLELELLNHADLFGAKWVRIEEFFRVEIWPRADVNMSRLMLGKYTVKLKIINDEIRSCSKIEQFTLLVGNNLINEKEIGNFLQVIKSKKKIDEIDVKSNSRLLQVNNNNNNNKSVRVFLKSDYVLLLILVVIVLITAILLVFIGAICLCARYKKVYKKSTKKKCVVDLNSSTSSKDSHTLSKPQYSLVSNNSGSNATSNGTLAFDDDAPIISVGSIRQQMPRNAAASSKHVRYIYASPKTPDVNFGYESNRSNSAAESIVDSTLIDDSKSNNSESNDFEIASQLTKHSVRKFQPFKSQLGSEPSSAYSSITNSDCNVEIEHFNKKSYREMGGNLLYVESGESSFRKAAPSEKNFLSFKQSAMKGEATSNSFALPPLAPRPLIRTSFNL